MYKFMTIAMVSFTMFGCASKGSVSVLDERVTAIETADTKTVAEVESLKADHATLQSNVSEVNAKLDRMLSKR